MLGFSSGPSTSSSSPQASPDGALLHLHLLVTEGEQEVCRVEMPVAAAEALETLFPEATQARIEQQGFDFEAAKSKVAASGFGAQAILDCVAGVRRYQVWIG